MYLRHTTVTKNGRPHTYWRLVRSVRSGHKVRQETVAQLGELDARGRVKAQALARSLVGVERQPGLFDEELPEQPLEVDLKRLRLERGRRFGDVWLGLRLWQALGLDQWLEQWLPRGREAVPWSAMVAVLVIARLCEPSSELHIAEDWFRRTALSDLLGLAEAKVNDDRLYRALDRLLPHKDALEQHLQARLGTLFRLEDDLLLYDVTSTYFEGQAAANRLAARGYSRDHRPDCKQVCIGLVVTREGYPLGYEVFAGNRHDVTTVQEIVGRMEERDGREGRIWALDRGMISEANLQWLQARGSRYIVGTPKSQLRRFERQVVAGGWQQVREGLEVQRSVSPEGDKETYLLCRSADRAAKERAMLVRFESRIEAGLEKLRRACDGRRSDCGTLERRGGGAVGRETGRNGGAPALLEVTVGRRAEGGAGMTWSKKSARQQWAEHSHGCYMLRSNVADWTAEELWRAYIQLTQAEAAFRIQKSDLRLRPRWPPT